MVRTIPIPAAGRAAPLRSKRLLALGSDERLVEQIRKGSEAAFEVAYERHSAGILSFCRHMLGSRDEAEDAVQQAFASAYSDLLRDERDINLKPWLYTIARNRCLSMLRARRETPAEQQDVPVDGLDDRVQQRADLRQLLVDMRELPQEQRAALLLSEVSDLSHPQIAEVLGCEVPKVKALVFRARSGLIDRKQARETPCEEIREQLANLRGGSLRRSELRHHLRSCPGCFAYREEVRRQRQLMAIALPVIPSVGLKGGVLSALGLTGGSGGGGAAAAGGAVAAAMPVGAATFAKVAIVGVLAGGGAFAGKEVLDDDSGARPTPPAAVGSAVAGNDEDSDGNRGSEVSAAAKRRAAAKRAAKRRAAAERKAAKRKARRKAKRRGPPAVPGERGRGLKVRRRRGEPNGRGPISLPPNPPVARGPVTPKPAAPPPEPLAPVKPLKVEKPLKLPGGKK